MNVADSIFKTQLDFRPLNIKIEKNWDALCGNRAGSYWICLSAGKISHSRRRIGAQDRRVRRKSLRLWSAFYSARSQRQSCRRPVTRRFLGFFPYILLSISLALRRQSISGSFSYKVVFAGGQSQVTGALARSTSISRSIYEAVEQVLRASQLACFSSSSKVNLFLSLFLEFSSLSFFFCYLCGVQPPWLNPMPPPLFPDPLTNSRSSSLDRPYCHRIVRLHNRVRLFVYHLNGNISSPFFFCSFSNSKD